MSERIGTSRYGSLYWCIKTPISETNEIYLMADRLEITDAGALICWGAFRARDDDASQPEQILLTLAPGQWIGAFAANIMDGSAVAVDHWKGEIER